MDVNLFSTAIALIGLFGGGAGYFAKSRAEAIIKLQAEEIDILTKRLATEKEEKAAIAAERDGLIRTNRDLKELAQGSPKLGEISKELKSIKEVIKNNGRRTAD